MYIEQSDLFRGMDRHFVKEILGITTKESHEEGAVLFRDGDKANRFFILLKGHVRLITGEAGHVVHVVSHPGEAFGWSSLVGRDVYTATAECGEPTKLVKIEAEKFQEVLKKDPANGLDFFKRLAGTLGNRLLQSYKMISAASEATPSVSTGTGQLQESPATAQ
jgi:CRP-like cAMP-binding protein